MKNNKRQLIIKTALNTFFKYGYKRVNMKEIAEVAGISRQGLYLYFKTKDEILVAAIKYLAEELLAEIRIGLLERSSVEDKLIYAFEVWCVRSFDLTLKSPEEKEIRGYLEQIAANDLSDIIKRFQLILKNILEEHEYIIDVERLAKILDASVRGLKRDSRSSSELRLMISDLVTVFLQTQKN